MWREALLVGGGVGLGFAILIAEIVPRRPKLAAALVRLGEQERPASVDRGPLKERLGEWGIRNLSGWPGFKVPEPDLLILGQAPTTYFSNKLILLILFSIIVPLSLSSLSLLLGFPLYIPAVGLLLGIPLGWVALALGDEIVKSAAREAREEFARAIATYYELVALERFRGATISVALEESAAVGTGWCFQLIGERLRQAKLTGIQPWTAIEKLSKEIEVPELRDVAHITRLSGEEGTAVYDSLRQRGIALRTRILNKEHLSANQISERMTYPQAILGIVFLAILVTPPLLQLTNF